ncbi:MAG: PilZ domain-containing protein [Candidatus Aminicenantes bacterium]|nr:PilZ domain-containing protein [Candidatus Aminicenantes bacterium]
MKNRPSREKMEHPTQQERRAFVRFEVPGASLCYREKRLLRKGFSEEFCPVENLSRGGLRMICRMPLRPGRRLSLRLSFEEDDLGIEWGGRVAWIYPVRAADFSFSAGISFDPLEGRKNPEAAAARDALESLEKKYGRR